MLKKSHYIALGVVVLVALILLNLPDQAAARLKLAIGSLFLPLFGLTSSSHQAIEKTGAALVPRGELLKQNESLHRENQELRIREMQLEEAKHENDRLHQLLGWQSRTPWKLKLANVVLREPANWWRDVWIDLGSRDGVRVNMPVLTTDGLVGRISSVSYTRSQVVLLGDPNCHVAAVENETRVTGVVGTAGPFDSSLLEMSYLSKNENLKPGANVVTSGNGGIFPPGIPIGKIVDSRQVEYGLYTEARVKLSANLSALEEVWVLFNP